MLPDNIRNKFGELNELGQKRLVYFNSNEYHGNRYITEEALEAGYINPLMNRNADMFDKGISSVLTTTNGDAQDNAQIVAENQLLRVLVLYASARRAVMSMIESNSIDGWIEWSIAEKEWLFERLTSRDYPLPSNLVGPDDVNNLRNHLLQLQSAKEVFPTAISPPPQLCESSNSTAAGERQPVAQPEPDAGDTYTVMSEIEQDSQDAFPSVMPPPPSESLVAVTKEQGIESSMSATESSDILLSADPRTTLDVDSEDFEADELKSNNLPVDGLLDKSIGMLDCFFTQETVSEENIRNSISPEEKAELAAQDYYSSLMLVSQKKQLSQKLDFLADATSALFQHREKLSTEEAKAALLNNNETKSSSDLPTTQSDDDNDSSLVSFRNMTVSPDGLKEMCSHLSSEVQNQVKYIQSLTETHKRISNRLLDATIRNERSKDQKTTYDEICKNLKQHMTELDQWSAPLPSDSRDGATLDIDDEPYEDYLERLQREQGELYEDDRMWTPEDIVDKIPPLQEFGNDHLLKDSSDDDEESIEEFEERMKRDWGWLEENEIEKAKEKKRSSPIDSIDLSEFKLNDGKEMEQSSPPVEESFLT